MTSCTLAESALALQLTLHLGSVSSVYSIACGSDNPKVPVRIADNGSSPTITHCFRALPPSWTRRKSTWAGFDHPDKVPALNTRNEKICTIGSFYTFYFPLFTFTLS